MSHELTAETLSHAQLCEINGPDYNPRDNRTFKDIPLAMYSYGDIKIRIALQKLDAGERGNVSMDTVYGRILAPVLAQNVGEDSVLHFPQAKDFDTSVKIKTIKATTLLPPSLVRRYNEEKSPIYTQSLPIYFNTKKEVFFSPLDERFNTELADSDHHTILVNDIKLTRGKYKQRFVIEDETLSGLQNKLQKLRTDDELMSSYKNYYVDFDNGERVIVMHFNRSLNDDEDRSELLRSDGSNPLIEVQGVEWSYYQAALVGRTLYLMDEKGEIDKQNTLSYDPKDFISKLDPYDKKDLKSVFELRRRKTASLIMPYSDESWRMVSGLHARLNSLFDELQTLLLSTKSETGQLDAPLANVSFKYALGHKGK